MRFDCVSRTHVGLKRKINEDSILVETPRGLWAVADGMGGHESGEVASGMVVDSLRALRLDGDLDHNIDQAVEALRDVNRALIDLARAQERNKSIGTTVVGVAIGDGEFRCFWAGDSRAYLLRDGELARLSRDHSLVQDLIDAGMLTPEEGEGHANSNVITRAVGVAETLSVDVVHGEVLPGDQFLLASDGLTRVIGDDELAAELRGRPLEQVADRLLERVLERGAPDNVSLIIAQVL